MQNLKTLFTRISRGDERAFTQLFRTHSMPIRSYIQRVVKDEYIALDMVQETFLKIWFHKEILPIIENPSSWIYSIASNLCLNYIRVRVNDTRLLEQLASEVPVSGHNAEGHIQAEKIRTLIKQGMAEMPHQRRIIYAMSRERHLSRKEIAKSLGISETTVRSQLAASVSFLREYIAKHTGVVLPLLLFLPGSLETATAFL